jgi:hypothetical protein
MACKIQNLNHYTRVGFVLTIWTFDTKFKFYAVSLLQFVQGFFIWDYAQYVFSMG